jgi:hypothetical protein
MARDKQHNPDPNENAARIVGQSAAAPDSHPADLEAAWAEWSRGMSLLRAAFEAGYEARR